VQRIIIAALAAPNDFAWDILERRVIDRLSVGERISILDKIFEHLEIDPPDEGWEHGEIDKQERLTLITAMRQVADFRNAVAHGIYRAAAQEGQHQAIRYGKGQRTVQMLTDNEIQEHLNRAGWVIKRLTELEPELDLLWFLDEE